MPHAPWWSYVLLLLIFPVALAVLIFIHKSLPVRLTFFFASGLFMNHWMHVWSYRLHDRLSNPQSATRLNVFFTFAIDWKLSLLAGLLFFAILYFLLRTIWNPEKTEVTFTFIALLGIVSVIASQVAASGVPKLAIEAALFSIYLLGLFSWKYFLSYGCPDIVAPAQIQSDSLTSFGIMLSLLALWLPAALSFGSFLFQYYQTQGDLGVQLQMTRYAAGVAYSLFGFGVVILEILDRLVRARGKL
jgi:hypothetical protein